jgi:hypothetical protein
MGICTICLDENKLSYSMDAFYTKINGMSNEQRKTVLTNFINQLRQQQQHPVADALYDILACYPKYPFSVDERQFRLYLAWCKFFEFHKNPLVKQIINLQI